jgi:plasmid stabilization system protein ParE
MQVIVHERVSSDITGILRHVFEASGDRGAAARREREITALVDSIAANAHSGTRLGGRFRGWLVRHGGARRMVTIVFRPDDAAGAVLVALVAFGAQDWLGAMEERRDFAG